MAYISWPLGVGGSLFVSSFFSVIEEYRSTWTGDRPKIVVGREPDHFIRVVQVVVDSHGHLLRLVQLHFNVVYRGVNWIWLWIGEERILFDLLARRVRTGMNFFPRILQSTSRSRMSLGWLLRQRKPQRPSSDARDANPGIILSGRIIFLGKRKRTNEPKNKIKKVNELFFLLLFIFSSRLLFTGVKFLFYLNWPGKNSSSCIANVEVFVIPAI